MKLTTIQRLHIIKGEIKLKKKANHAATVLIYGGQTEGSYFTERGKRTNRGKEIN
jgi:hypothetical protein